MSAHTVPHQSQHPGQHLGRPGGRDRIESLDVLRGIAVLGIFMVNIQTFAMTPLGFANPTIEGDFTAQGQRLWVMVVTLFQLKFITIFSALFGAGIVLMAGEGSDRSDFERERLHWRRMMGLLVIGVIHAYGVWYGDILVPYALAGLVLFGARGWSVRRLIITGVALAALTNALVIGTMSAILLAPPDIYAEIVAESWAPPPEVVAEQVRLFQASYAARWPELAAMVAELEMGQVIVFGPRVVGVMMVGMGLYKSGFFTARWPLAAYLGVALLAPIGAVASWWSARDAIAVQFDLIGVIPGQAVLFTSSLVQAFGYAAIVMLACRVSWLALARAPFAAAGRMALTNYLACSLVGALVFYGPPGLGHIGALSRLEQVQFVGWTWLVILVASSMWLSVFRFGPCEWLWRTVTYQRPQALRR